VLRVVSSIWRRRDTVWRWIGRPVLALYAKASTINPAIRAYRPGFSTPVALFVSGVTVGALVMWMVPAPVAGDVASSTTGGADVAANVAAVIPPAAGGPSVTTPAVPIPVTRSPAGEETARPAPLRTQRPAPARRAATVPAPRFRGSLAVRSRPAGASVFVNGRLVGKTPLVLRNQAVGSRAIRVTMDGYEAWTAAARVVVNQQSVVTASLQPASPLRGDRRSPTDTNRVVGIVTKQLAP
jgi:hypothetical protein